MDVKQFQVELTDFLKSSGISQSKLAQRANVPQSQISDWNKGKIIRFSKNSKRVLRAIENYRKSDQESLPSDVEAAVRNFCGGKKENSKLLVNLLSTLHSITLTSTQ